MATANTRRNKNAHSLDLYTTPRIAVDAILSREKLNGRIIDAGSGTGNIKNFIADYGYTAKGVDIYDHNGSVDVLQNYLKYDDPCECVISNPPFTLLSEFIIHSLTLASDKVLIFARVTALESKGRFNGIYKDNPPNRIYFFVNRVKCSKYGIESDGASAVFYCWLVWDKKDPSPQQFFFIE